MKKLVLIALVLSGCVTNGEIDYGKTALLVGTVALGAALASSSSDTLEQDCYWSVTAHGSTQVCR